MPMLFKKNLQKKNLQNEKMCDQNMIMLELSELLIQKVFFIGDDEK